MKRLNSQLIASAFAAALLCGGCGGKSNPALDALPTPQVQHERDGSIIQLDHPEQFPVAAAVEYDSAPQLVVTGVVNADPSRTVPVVTLASGRVVNVRARLGDSVQKGQVLFQVRSSDVSGGYSDYRKAVADEILARKQLDRENDLYAYGAVRQGDLEAAQDAEDDAKTTLETAAEHLRLIGNDPDNPTGLVDIAAPVSGVITDQEVTDGSSVQSYSTNPFQISDLSYVWVVCDVYENDLSDVQLGEAADIRLNAYPGQTFTGRISNVGAILDPSLHTAKVRIEVKNLGLMRVGMFATATFYGLKKEPRAAIPADAILHLHDRDWVFVPQSSNQFRRTEIVAGRTLPNKMQEVLSGLQAGQRVVRNALALQNTMDNE